MIFEMSVRNLSAISAVFSPHYIQAASYQSATRGNKSTRLWGKLTDINFVYEYLQGMYIALVERW